MRMSLKTKMDKKFDNQFKLKFNGSNIGYYKSKTSLSCATKKLVEKSLKNNNAVNSIEIENLSGVNIGKKKYNIC